ncbi:MAG: hypothetical protein PHH77_09210 [Victivallaceae bacterium]|nr:hypothetical protein [Victivallaceae bacterium]
MKYELEIDAEDVYRQAQYRIRIRNSLRAGMRLHLAMWLLKVAGFICPGELVVEETDKFTTVPKSADGSSLN